MYKFILNALILVLIYGNDILVAQRDEGGAPLTTGSLGGSDPCQSHLKVLFVHRIVAFVPIVA